MADADEQQLKTTFTTFLIEHRQGSLHAELTEQLAALVRSVRETGKAGSMTVKIEVKPAENGINLVVTDDLTIKPPKPSRGAALFFSDEDGNLSRRDPQQLELGSLRKVGDETKENAL